jgi:hypothetical protein
MQNEKFGKQITTFATFREMLYAVHEITYRAQTPDNYFCLRDAELLEEATNHIRIRLDREKARAKAL